MEGLIWLDFETGGLEPMTSAPIEICMVETDNSGVILRELTTKIFPAKLVEPEAAKVNGYTPAVWENAPLLGDVHDKINSIPWTPGCRLAGWNIYFDWKFWQYYFQFYVNLKYHHHHFDLMGLAWPLIRKMEKKSLDQTYFIVKDQYMREAHTAKGDVMAMIEIYKDLVDRFDGVS